MYCCLCNAPIEMLLFILYNLLFQDEEPPNYSLTDNSVDAGTVTFLFVQLIFFMFFICVHFSSNFITY